MWDAVGPGQTAGGYGVGGISVRNGMVADPVLGQE